MAGPDQKTLDVAVQQALSAYPRFKQLGYPIKLTTGSGKFESETYLPNDDENPAKGNLTIQLRSQEALSDPTKYPLMVASEALHGAFATDPVYQVFTKSFVQSMTPGQVTAARQAYRRELAESDTRESFEEWLPRVQAQEYIRGYLFPSIDDKTGEWARSYTPQQKMLFERLRRYLMMQ